MRAALAMRIVNVLFVGAVGVGISGCGAPVDQFQADYTAAFCDHYLKCEDPAVLVFDGIESASDCTSIISPEVVAWGSACKYKAGKAKKCLDAMAALSCPTDEGAGFPFSQPPECVAVYDTCTFDPFPTPEGDADTDTDADSDADTDADTDG